jgi:hypothetical protein
MFPKKGNSFPNVTGGDTGKIDYPAAIAAALRAELGNSHQAVKTVMRWTGANERTVKNWLAGSRGPRGEHLLALLRHSNVTLEVVLQLADRQPIIAGTALFNLRHVLAGTLAKIDLCLNGEADRR